MTSNRDELPNRTVLYYPTINVPTDDWLRQTLLYWDGIGSIVPEEYDNEKKLSSDIQFLKTEGFFKSYRPWLAFERDENKISLKKELNEIISSESFQKTLSLKDERRISFTVYKDKVLHSIFQTLKARGLARSMGNEPYYLFEENTYYIYMALLARHICLGVNHAEILSPGTNIDVYENLVFKTNSTSNGTPSIEMQLRNLLPVPREDTPLDDILSFRHRRRSELLRFRLVLNQLQSKLKSCQSQDDAREILANFQEEIADSQTNLQKSMKSDNIKLSLGTLGSIIPAFGEIIKGTFDPIANGIPTLLGTVVVGYCLLKKFQEHDIVSNSPVSYLFHIEKEFSTS